MRIASKVLLTVSPGAFLWFYGIGMAMPQGWLPTLVKGMAVGSLGLMAAIEGRGREGRLLALVLGFGAAGDMGVEWHLVAGAGLFLIGHMIAVALYWQCRRPGLAASQKLLALAMLPAIPLIAFALPDDRALAPLAAIYALALSAMAAAAWTSRFSRYRAGLGAMLFVVSDLLIFARLGPLAQSPVPDLLIWPCYYAGQALICLGVLRAVQDSGRMTEPSAPRSSGA